MTSLAARIEALEEANAQPFPDVKTLLTRITGYGFRRPEDFDKYDALALVEQLATSSKINNDEKAHTYSAILSTLLKKLSSPTKQFKAYYVAYKEYSKLLDTVVKLDKVFKKAGSQPASSPSTPYSRPRPTIYCFSCGMPGHVSSRCYRRQARLFSPRPLTTSKK